MASDQMTFGQIQSYARHQGWDIGHGGYDWNLARDGVMPCDVTIDPPAVYGWFVREVMPAIQRTGEWIWPNNLDTVGRRHRRAGQQRPASPGTWRSGTGTVMPSG